MVNKGYYNGNEMKYGYAVELASLKTDWIDEYDEDGAQHFISYYPYEELVHTEGYYNLETDTLTKLLYYDKNGAMVDEPVLLYSYLISYK